MIAKNCRKSFRSSRPEVFRKNGVLRYFAKFTGKNLCQSLLFNKVAGLRPFPVNFAKFLRTLFLRNTSRWLLLKLGIWLKRYHKSFSEAWNSFFLKKKKEKKEKWGQAFFHMNMLRESVGTNWYSFFPTIY